jgi:hypothetical protein
MQLVLNLIIVSTRNRTSIRFKKIIYDKKTQFYKLNNNKINIKSFTSHTFMKKNQCKYRDREIVDLILD